MLDFIFFESSLDALYNDVVQSVFRMRLCDICKGKDLNEAKEMVNSILEKVYNL